MLEKPKKHPLRPPLILASLSPFRKSLLHNAGLDFSVAASDIDERSIERQLGKITPKALSQELAKAKALAVSKCHPQAVVIGCDQTLDFLGEALHKPKNLAQAKQRLELLSNQSHSLHSAMALAQNGKILMSDVETAVMTFRPLSAAFIDNYVQKAGEAILGSVGAYQIEGAGIQLFEKIKGDYFTIIGLPLLPLLQALRQLAVIDA